MTSELSTLFGSIAQTGQKMGGGLARQTKREIDTVSARTEIAHHTDQARAFLTSAALNNVGTLVSQAEQMMQIAPSGAQFYEAILTAYAVGASTSIARFQ